MKASDAFPSKYIKAADLQGKKMRLTIQSVKMESVASDEPDKPVMYFKGAQKAMCLNRTNMNVLIELYGDETGDWTGKSIIVYPTKTDYQGKRVDCLRLEAPPAGKAQEAPPPPPPADEHFDDADIPF